MSLFKKSAFRPQNVGAKKKSKILSRNDNIFSPKAAGHSSMAQKGFSSNYKPSTCFLSQRNNFVRCASTPRSISLSLKEYFSSSQHQKQYPARYAHSSLISLPKQKISAQSTTPTMWNIVSTRTTSVSLNWNPFLSDRCFSKEKASEIPSSKTEILSSKTEIPSSKKKKENTDSQKKDNTNSSKNEDESRGRKVETDLFEPTPRVPSTPEEQYQKGFLCHEGLDENADPAQAFFWFEKAAENGHGQAQATVGTCYHEGCGVEQDRQKALTWFQTAAQNQVSDAFYWLGYYYQ